MNDRSSRGAARRSIVFIGALCLSFGVAASALLALEHLGQLSLPGCGEGGPCEQAANSIWGKVPLGPVAWPTAYLGLTYFLAALVAWLVARGALPTLGRWMARGAVAASVAFLLLILIDRTYCLYCVAAHLGNLAFGLAAEAARDARRPLRGPAVAFAAVFVGITLLLALGDVAVRARVGARAEAARQASADEILARADTQDAPAEAPFSGRYPVGPRESPIRIVVFTDYQCHDCYTIEKQLEQIHAARDDVSISIKHFPFNRDCNPFVSRTLHSNACWAARAAEAAGILWGSEGFRRMSGWLFQRRGLFRTTRELAEGIRSLGYDPAGFSEVMSSEETAERVRADCQEAQRLGLFFTPMIFINGVELKGWMAPQALARTIEQIAASDPPARSAHHDRPPAAYEKYVADWRDQPRRRLPPDAQVHARGPQGAALTVVMWGDYREPITARADSILRAFADRSSDVRYVYRHYPLHPDCNPVLEEARHPLACRAARVAEAAAQLGGEEGFWRLHGWLMQRPAALDDAALGGILGAAGIETEALLAQMATAAVASAIADDVAAGQVLPSLRHGAPSGIHALPTIFIDERYVPRWSFGERLILEDILRTARAEVGLSGAGRALREF